LTDKSFLHDRNLCLFEMPVKGIYLINPLSFHDDYRKSIIDTYVNL